MINGTNFEAQLELIESEMDRATIAFQEKERQVEELHLAIEEAKKRARDAEREAVQKSSEHVKAENEMRALKMKVETYHRRFNEVHQMVEHARIELKKTVTKKS
jgi:chromosome segregation ATPase